MKHNENSIKPGPAKTLHERYLSIALGILTILTIVFLLVRKISEYDIWFHLMIGRDILANAILPTVERYSLLALGQPLHDPQILFQIVMAFGYNALGFWWLHAVQFLLWGLTFWFVYRAIRDNSSPPAAFLLLLLAVIASEERFTIRPELISIALIAWMYWRLQQGKFRTPLHMVQFVILQVVWTNAHGIFIIGPFFPACYLATAALRREDKRDARPLLILTLLMASACLLSPYGFEGLSFAWRLATQLGPTASPYFKTIYEFQSPLGASSRQTIAFWFYLSLIIVFVVSLAETAIFRFEKLAMARTMIGMAMLVTSLSGIKNMPMFAVVAAPLIAENLSLLSSRHRKSILAISATAIFCAGWFWSPVPALEHAKTWLPYRFGIGVSSDYVPLGLSAFLDRIGFQGQVYNSQGVGGYYGFISFPRRLSFYDGRLETYNPHVLERVFNTAVNASKAPADWQSMMEHYGFTALLLENGSAEASGLLPLVSSDRHWRLVYLDHAASFWLRVDYSPLPAAIDHDTVSRLVGSAENFAQAENLDLFLEKSGLFTDLRIPLLTRASREWDRPVFMSRLGLAQLSLGNYDEAEKIFIQLLNRYPKSVKTITTLAQIALFRHDLITAENYLNQAIRLEPDDAELRENLERVRGMKR